MLQVLIQMLPFFIIMLCSHARAVAPVQISIGAHHLLRTSSLIAPGMHDPVPTPSPRATAGATRTRQRDANPENASVGADGACDSGGGAAQETGPGLYCASSTALARVCPHAMRRAVQHCSRRPLDGRRRPVQADRFGTRANILQLLRSSDRPAGRRPRECRPVSECAAPAAGPRAWSSERGPACRCQGGIAALFVLSAVVRVSDREVRGEARDSERDSDRVSETRI